MSTDKTIPGSPRRENGTPSRWEQYRELLVAKRIPQKAQRWYVTHVQDFLALVKPSSLKGLSADEITGYLRQTSRQGKWQDWQCRQLVDALQLLLVDLADVKSARVIDWDYWREAGAALPADHPTIAREQAPEARLKEPRFASSAEAFPILTTLARTLRAKQYSIRTVLFPVFFELLDLRFICNVEPAKRKNHRSYRYSRLRCSVPLLAFRAPNHWCLDTSSPPDFLQCSVETISQEDHFVP